MIPIKINQNFFEAIAKIIPSTESTANTITPKVKFASGPLMIKKKITLIKTVSIDKAPKISFLFKFNPLYNTVSQKGPMMQYWLTLIKD